VQIPAGTGPRTPLPTLYVPHQVSIPNGGAIDHAPKLLLDSPLRTSGHMSLQLESLASTDAQRDDYDAENYTRLMAPAIQQMLIAVRSRGY
jgi:hypothetical protein